MSSSNSVRILESYNNSRSENSDEENSPVPRKRYKKQNWELKQSFETFDEAKNYIKELRGRPSKNSKALIID